METCYNYTDETCYVSSDEQKVINKVLKLKEEYPDQVTIIKMPKENRGCIYGKVPSKWVRLTAIKKREYSEEERAKMAARMKFIGKVSWSEGEEENEY